MHNVETFQVICNIKYLYPESIYRTQPCQVMLSVHGARWLVYFIGTHTVYMWNYKGNIISFELLFLNRISLNVEQKIN